MPATDSESDDMWEQYDSSDSDLDADPHDPAALSPFETLDESGVRRAQADHVQYVVDALLLPKPLTERLLRHYKWDHDRLILHFLDDPDKVLAQVSSPPPSAPSAPSAPAASSSPPALLPPDPTPRRPSADTECQICFTVWPAADVLLTDCGAPFCNTCWRLYMREAVAQGKTDVPCPATTCARVVADAVIDAVMDARDLAKMRHYRTQAYVKANTDMRWCPGRGCGAVVRRCAGGRGVETSFAECMECKDEFCFGCGEEAHYPASCGDVKKWMDKCKDDSETFNWIAANTRDCPKCCSAIEKNGGCNHMMCRSCSYEFCWVCGKAWAQHSFCNNYIAQEGNPAENRTADEERHHRAQKRVALDRYLHYYTRYHNHEDSGKLAAKFMAQAQDKMRELHGSSNATWVELQFIEDATRRLLKCRHVLKWSYAHAFYLEDTPQKKLFEFLQGDLEVSTEKLNFLLESGANPMSAAMRNELVNLTDVARSMLGNLLQDFDHGVSL